MLEAGKIIEQHGSGWEWTKCDSALPSLTSPAISVPHGFFTRVGGVSDGGYASLNGSLGGGDDRANVTENRRRIAADLGLPATHLLVPHEVHGAHVVHVTEPWARGAGPKADAMVTATPGLALGILTADCAPVLLTDAGAGVVGAAHAGWQGALGGVLEATLDAMTALGARHITAFVGPCIHQASYEVGSELRDAFLAHNPAATSCFQQGAADGKFQFDLPGYCAARLAQAGAEVHQSGIDTYADAERFYSHRRRTRANNGGVIGNQLSVIRL